MDPILIVALLGVLVAAIGVRDQQRREGGAASRLCEHPFVTAQGQPLTAFRRAIDSRSILLAELAAREGGRLPLEDAVALVALYARLDDAKFEWAAVRWLARYALERQPTLGRCNSPPVRSRR